MRLVLILGFGFFYFLYSAPSLKKCEKDLNECLAGVRYYTNNYSPKQAQEFKAVIDKMYLYVSEQIHSAKQAVFQYYLDSYLVFFKLPKIFTSPPDITTKLERDRQVVIKLDSQVRIFQIIPGEGFLAQFPYVLCDSLSNQSFCQLIFVEKKSSSEYAEGDILPPQYYIYDGVYTYSTINGSSKTVPKYRDVTKEIIELREKATVKSEEYFQKYENKPKQ
ncbi:hypothetical protein BKH42_00870 [Helicobacter sp. 13S00482-2]|uniref:hypothetical protein n=1 Tax=Helicobacter sp. 13S00482-2 TaxID=1476200 RepID=UPI000BA649A5|nr:hypothetical protein [Helicobacter sp. 13S00482-2]PAF54493.1 hypothetical protein BKH42_00870 [Helicobacter sp. 13S00482-2]